MHTEKDQEMINQIYDLIAQLEDAGCHIDFENDYNHITEKYDRYIEKFNDAKNLLGINNDTSNVTPIDNPRDVLNFYAYFVADNQKAFLAEFNRKKPNIESIKNLPERLKKSKLIK